jgi:broad specificity phosphatase PhoE
MRTFFIFLFSILSLGETYENPIAPPLQEATTHYYFIRHAEKEMTDPQDRNPQLSEAGIKRTAKWAEVFEEVEFDLIYSSNYHRTMNTARAVTDKQQKKIDIFDPKKLNDTEFQKKTKGKTVLVVGHSNTNPAFVNLLLGENKYQDLDETEYGSLFIVTVSPDGEKTSQVLFIN